MAMDHMARVMWDIDLALQGCFELLAQLLLPQVKSRQLLDVSSFGIILEEPTHCSYRNLVTLLADLRDRVKARFAQSTLRN